jgi:hypothetical protein
MYCNDSPSRVGSGRRGKGVGVPFRDAPPSATLELRGWGFASRMCLSRVHG